MKYRNDVKEVHALGGYRLRVSFTDGFTGEVDMWPSFANPRGPMTVPFKDVAFFQQVRIDPELGVVAWPNGYDICSDVLRYYCELGHVASKEEMTAHFAPEPVTSGVALVMNDKPQA